jgi:hypothetical protein
MDTLRGRNTLKTENAIKTNRQKGTPKWKIW